MAKTTAPASPRVVGWLALLWNLVGVAMFFLQTSLTAEQVAAMPPDRQLVYEAMPDWLTVAYAVAVFGGVIGAVGLPMAVLVVGIAAFLLWYARRAGIRGWIG